MTLVRASGAADVEADAGAKIAERQFLDAMVAVEDIVERLKRQEVDDLPDLQKLAASAGAATRQLLTERQRVSEHQKRTIGVVRDYAIDFDAAREEIGRRLARLRAASGDGSVSGGTD